MEKRMEQEVYRIYLKQHIGKPALACVSPGDAVKAGELVGRADEGISLNVHASVTGIIAQVTGEYVDIRKTQESETYIPLTETDPLNLIRESGLCGMGGAGFPTHIKLKTDLSQEGIVIVNAAECEPILEHNIHRIITNPSEVAAGLRIAMDITKAAKGIIAIKEKQKEAIASLTRHLDGDMELFSLPDIYPMGEERALIREITGTLLDPQSLPSSVHAVVINSETVYRIFEAVVRKKPVIAKDVTVGGAVTDGTTIYPDVPIGSNVGSLLEKSGGLKADVGELIMGGPFTGKRITEDACIGKTTGGIIAAMPFIKDARDMGLLVCACGGNEERLREIADSMGAHVVGVEFCKQAQMINGNLKCDNPGKCPGQSQKVLQLRKAGAQTLLISNCTDCSNTVMSIAPQLKMPVYHCTDGAMRAAGKKLVRKIHL